MVIILINELILGWNWDVLIVNNETNKVIMNYLLLVIHLMALVLFMKEIF